MEYACIPRHPGKAAPEQKAISSWRNWKEPIYSNYTSKPYPENCEEISELISKQVSNSVKWEKTLRRMYENGCDTFIECGPGTTLSGFVKKTLKDVEVYNVSDMESLNEVCEKLAVYA